MLAFLIVTGILIGIYGSLHHIWNKRSEQQEAVSVPGNRPSSALFRLHRKHTKFSEASRAIENEEFADFTDFQLRNFKYPV